MTDLKTIISPDTLRAQRVPPGQRLTERFPVLHYGAVPRIDLAKWRFRLSGWVAQPVELDLAQFEALPRVQLVADIHCVTGWSKLNTHWEGVPSVALRELVSLRPEARYAIVQAAGGFTTNLSLDDFFAEDVLFALKYEGEPIAPEHGAPVRLVVPRLYFWKSAKWVTGVYFRKDDQPGFWESRGYHNRGDPWKEERYS